MLLLVFTNQDFLVVDYKYNKHFMQRYKSFWIMRYFCRTWKHNFAKPRYDKDNLYLHHFILWRCYTSYQEPTFSSFPVCLEWRTLKTSKTVRQQYGGWTYAIWNLGYFIRPLSSEIRFPVVYTQYLLKPTQVNISHTWDSKLETAVAL